MRKSVWTDSVELPEFKQLNGDIKTDVLIIGAGLCGILCAYFLKQKNIDYVLVESKTIASGITKNTTAKITSQHGLIYNKLINLSLWCCRYYANSTYYFSCFGRCVKECDDRYRPSVVSGCFRWCKYQQESSNPNSH